MNGRYTLILTRRFFQPLARCKRARSLRWLNQIRARIQQATGIDYDWFEMNLTQRREGARTQRAVVNELFAALR